MNSIIKYSIELEGRVDPIYLSFDGREVNVSALGLEAFIEPFEVIENRLWIEVDISGGVGAIFKLSIEVAETDTSGQAKDFKKIEGSPIVIHLNGNSSNYNRPHNL